MQDDIREDNGRNGIVRPQTIALIGDIILKNLKKNAKIIEMEQNSAEIPPNKRRVAIRQRLWEHVQAIAEAEMTTTTEIVNRLVRLGLESQGSLPKTQKE